MSLQSGWYMHGLLLCYLRISTPRLFVMFLKINFSEKLIFLPAIKRSAFNSLKDIQFVLLGHVSVD